MYSCMKSILKESVSLMMYRYSSEIFSHVWDGVHMLLVTLFPSQATLPLPFFILLCLYLFVFHPSSFPFPPCIALETFRNMLLISVFYVNFPTSVLLAYCNVLLLCFRVYVIFTFYNFSFSCFERGPPFKT